MIKSLKCLIANSINITIKDIEKLQKKAPFCYKEYSINKKTSGQRIIAQPSNKVKAVQHALINVYYNKFPIHDCAKAYRRGFKSPVRKNVEIHARLKYSVRIDFCDFFPSIKSHNLTDIINSATPDLRLSEEDRSFVSDFCFRIKNNTRIGLAIGAPSSPIISNIVMFNFDSKAATYVNRNFTGAVYTRYADDIVFSTNTKGACDTFYQWMQSHVCELPSPSLTINTQKTAFMSRGTRRKITGLYITPEGNISIGRLQKRYIRKLIYDYINNNISVNNKKYLRGYLAYILDVDSDFFNNLVMKYDAHVLNDILLS